MLEHTFHVLCACHDVLSPTEVVRMDVVLSIKKNVLHFNRDFSVSVDLSVNHVL